MTGKQQKIQGAIVEEVEFDTESEGYQIYAGASCIGCHGDAFQGGLGKPLVNTGLTADEIVTIAHDGTRRHACWNMGRFR